MGLSHWLKPAPAPPVTSNHVVLRAANAQEPSLRSDQPLEMRAAPFNAERLNTACRKSAEQLAGQLGPGCRVIVRAPFVIGGDFSEAELAGYHDRTIGPAARAMAHAYFQTPPDKPISVL